jgi:hypothetical protein
MRKSVPFLMTLFFLLLGCSQGKENLEVYVPAEEAKNGENQMLGGVWGVEISPHEPSSDESLMVLVQEQMGGRLAPTLLYQWHRNGVLIPGVTSNHLPKQHFGKGDLIFVQVSNPKGVDQTSKIKSDPVSILNTPPRVLSVSFKPEQPRSGQPIEAAVQGLDYDEDSLEYAFRWYKNEQEIEGETSSVLEPEHFKKGDRIQVEVKAFDGENEGDSFSASPLIVLNTPPIITSKPPFSMGDNGEYQYTIQAEDPDGDNVFFEMVKGPEGMAMDSQRGSLSWKPSPNEIGTHSIEIAAVDPDGAKGIQKYDLEIFPLEAAVQ